jgi:hypothetical protein
MFILINIGYKIKNPHISVRVWGGMDVISFGHPPPCFSKQGN